MDKRIPHSRRPLNRQWRRRHAARWTPRCRYFFTSIQARRVRECRDKNRL